MCGVFIFPQMKNRFFVKHGFYVLLLITFSSCKKKDIILPTITLAGENNVRQILNTQWTDPGYQATDNSDGDITTNVVVSGKVNKDFAGTYLITYTVADNSGNETSVNRNVTIYNEAGFLAGKYFANDTCQLSAAVTYTAYITPSTSTNMEFTIENFGEWNLVCSCHPIIKMNMSGSSKNSLLSWNNQMIAGTDSLLAASGGGIISSLSPPQLSFSYQWANGNTTKICSSLYTHQ